MIIKNGLLLPLGMVLLLCSCQTDVFDSEPLDRLTEQQVWENAAAMDLYLVSLYGRFPWNDFPRGIAGAAGGEMFGSTPNPTRVSDSYGYWDWSYIRDLNLFLEEVAAAEIPEETRDRFLGTAKVMRAVAYFEKQKRYGGVPLVDEVIDPFAEGGVDERFLVRATEEEIADFIDQELTDAIPMLTSDHAGTGGINRWTALGYKARANLWAASVARFPAPTQDQSDVVGIPASRAEEFYEKAAAAAQEIIESGRYSLFTNALQPSPFHPDIPPEGENYRRIFLEDGNSEVIFERLYDGDRLAHNWAHSQFFQQWVSGGGGGSVTAPWGFERLDGSLDPPALGPDNRYSDGIQPWLDHDPRVFAQTWFQGESYLGTEFEIWEGTDPSPAGSTDPDGVLTDGFEEYEGAREAGEHSRNSFSQDNATDSGLHVKKYIPNEPPDGATFFHGIDLPTSWKNMRLAEIYLIKAEAEFELGNLEPAAEALNVTRQRAGLPPLEDVGGITRERVRTERLAELRLEGRRYWDFRRWRTAEEELDGTLFCGLAVIRHPAERGYYFLKPTTPGVGCENTERRFEPRHYYNPITADRIANNPLLVENPGY